MFLKNNFIKKVLAGLTAVSMMFAASSCGEYASWAMKYGEYTANAGVFIYYQKEALAEAKNILKKENEDIDLSDIKTLKTLKVENVDIDTWVNNKAQEDLKIYLAINEKFNELGLELDSETKEEIEANFQNRWLYYGEKESCEKNGTSEESFRSIIEFSYKEKEVFTHYYGKGGELEYSDSDLRAYLEGNYSRTKMIRLQLKDGSGQELDDAGKKEIKAMAEDYKKRAIAGESMDDLIKEYSDYYDKLVEEANKETSDESDDTTEAVTTAPETTAPVSEEPQTEDTSVPEDGQNEEVQGEETETSETQEDTSGETDDASEAVDTESTETPADVTTVPEGEEPPTDETAVSTETSSEETEADDPEQAEETDPYANESILFKGSEEDGYNPSKPVNEAAFNECVVDGSPVVVEDEENLMIYVVQRLDILERKDFLEGDVRDYLLWEILKDDFRVLELEWIDSSKLDTNDRAIKRYDPFKSVEE